MRALAILYHDVVDSHFDESGFPGAAAARYKMRRSVFAEHLLAMLPRAATPAVAAKAESLSLDGRPFFFTIDDGGACSLHIAEALEGMGWRGSFFIATDYIGAKGFVSVDDIRELSARGHAIGSHSRSHPYRIDRLGDELLQAEWADSVATLSDILGARTDTGSVPGGFYTPRVAAAARRAGIRLLFNSEPTTRVHSIGDCHVVGRHNVYGHMSAGGAAQLAAGDAGALLKQKLIWTAKKSIKTVAAPFWDRARRSFFQRFAG